MKIEEDDVVVTDPPIGYKMRRMRDIVGGKQEKIAIELGVTQQAVSEWERGTSIKKTTLDKYAKVLGVTSEAIINFEERAPMNFFTNCEFSGNGATGNIHNDNSMFNNVSTEMIEMLEKFLHELKGKK